MNRVLELTYEFPEETLWGGILAGKVIGGKISNTKKKADAPSPAAHLLPGLFIKLKLCWVLPLIKLCTGNYNMDEDRNGAVKFSTMPRDMNLGRPELKTPKRRDGKYKFLALDEEFQKSREKSREKKKTSVTIEECQQSQLIPPSSSGTIKFDGAARFNSPLYKQEVYVKTTGRD